MGNAISAAGAALCAAVSAVDLANYLNARQGASTRVHAHAQAPPPRHSGVRDLLLLTSAAGLSASVAFTYRHVRRGAGGNRRLPESVSFMLCMCAGVLQSLLFPRAPGGADVDHGEQARVLGLAALHVLPGAATVTFFLGTMLIVAGHIRAGGEGGGGAMEIAGEEPIQAPLGLIRLLSRMALAAAAGLIFLMVIAVYGAY